MKLFDLEHPTFRHLWVRVAVVAVLVLWTLFEFSNGAIIWGIIFGGLAAVCAWRFATIDYSASGDKGD